MTASALPVAVCQFAPGDTPETNRARVAELVADAARRGAKVIVLPEYSSYFTNPMDARLADHAEEIDGAFVQALQALAHEHAVVVVAGLVERADAGRVFNTVVAVSDAGVLAVYRKQHLYDAFGQSESDWIAPGPLGEASVFEAAGLRFGLMTCYDLRFPEVARTLADAAVDAIVVPAEWVRGPLKEHHWTTLLAARAIENTAYVIAADHPGPIGVGLSQIVDPQGLVVAGASSGEGIAMASVDPVLIASVRETNPALRLRRYGVVPRD
ncbi:Aliphatic amidase AmiE [Microbacterium esteraromaticum]|uniref:Aliphatic amidase AmiE n=1 Tax=Microbacterium esteraromaticum TaxID=57043 RepID=A0A1R4JEQ2_9MICO|nr:carbon-nitrogen hydrolase family protein [Microbacterium esteraromaticum]SJN30275.1 Aliphatic amidase AmiE [Microbacterium esteraromaticum]